MSVDWNLIKHEVLGGILLNIPFLRANLSNIMEFPIPELMSRKK